MEKLYHLLQLVNEHIGRAIAWMTILMVVITFLVVLLRYVFDLGWIAMQESIVYLHACVFMLGAAFTFKHQGHVRVDIFYQNYSVRQKAWLDLFGTLFLLIPVSFFIIWQGWYYVAASWDVLEGSREAGGLPGIFLLKSLIVVMPILMLLQGFAFILRQLLILQGRMNTQQDHSAEGGV